jgi:hypothetical protein
VNDRVLYQNQIPNKKARQIDLDFYSRN